MEWQSLTFWAAILTAAGTGAGAIWLIIRAAAVYQHRDYSGFKHHAKVHSFRFATAIATWLLIFAAFYYHPEWITWGLRTVTRGIETTAQALPYPWGDRAEIALRELGGFIWFQVTFAIVSLRVLLSAIAVIWRRFSARSAPPG